MSRSLDTPTKNAIYAPDSTETFITLLTINHGDFSIIRSTGDSVDTSHGGNTYSPYPFFITLPPEEGDKLPQVQLTIDAVDRDILAALRSVTTPPTVEMNVVLASDTETVVVGPYTYTLREIKYDVNAITGTLDYDDILNEAFPKDSFTPELYPGLF